MEHNKRQKQDAAIQVLRKVLDHLNHVVWRNNYWLDDNDGPPSALLDGPPSANGPSSDNNEDNDNSSCSRGIQSAIDSDGDSDKDSDI